MTVKVAPDIEADDIGDREYLIDDIEIGSMGFAYLLSGLHARLNIALPEMDYPRMISFAGMQSCLAEHGKRRGVPDILSQPDALELAFRVEQAQLELQPLKDVTEGGFGLGLENVLLQSAVLGCKVDSDLHKIGSNNLFEMEDDRQGGLLAVID